MKNKLLKPLTVDNIRTFYGVSIGDWNAFSIDCLTEDILSEEKVGELEYFFEELHFRVDMFNIEYMGFLTGRICGNPQQLIDGINKFFNI